MNQRHVELAVTGAVAGKGINVRAPADGTLAPPGHYMLFVVDAAGTPSVARWVRLGADAPDAPELAPDEETEPEETATPTPTPTPAPTVAAATPTAAPTPALPARDTRAPRLRLLWPAVRSGTRKLRPALQADEPARGRLTIRGGGRTLRRTVALRPGRTHRPDRGAPPRAPRAAAGRPPDPLRDRRRGRGRRGKPPPRRPGPLVAPLGVRQRRTDEASTAASGVL